MGVNRFVTMQLDQSMRRSLSFLTSTSSVAGAGLASSRQPGRSGTPLTLEVLGYDPAQARVYFREGSDRDGRERLVFFYTRGQHRGRLLAAAAAARPGSGNDSDSAALRRRLLACPGLPTGGFSLSARVTRRRAVRQPGYGAPIRKFTLRLLAAATPDKGLAEASPTHASVTVYLRPEARISAAYGIPGQPLAVIAVSYIGVPWELGVAKQIPLLVRLAPERSRSFKPLSRPALGSSPDTAKGRWLRP